MPQPPAKLDECAPFVKDMEAALNRALALLGGTDAMRAAGMTYLPRFPGEPDETYQNRLKGAVLNNFYEAIAGMMVGMMFRKPIQLEGSKIPDAILTDLDRRGANLNTLGADLAKALITKGRPHILVDHPKKPEEATTALDDERLGLRPYWVLMEPAAVISAWCDPDAGGEVLEHFRWREWATLRNGRYALKTVERIRVFERQAEGVFFELWQRDSSSDQFALEDDGALIGGGAKAIGEIPIVTLYSDRQRFMVSKPTLDDIAHKNIEHWQSSADQRHILTVSRFPILYQLGVKNAVALIGPYATFHTETSRKEAEIGYAEAEGKGAEQGWKDMDRIVAEAEAMTIRIVISDASKTDSGEDVDAAKEGSRLAKLATELERGLQLALIYTARWLGLPDEAAGKVTTHKDFGLSREQAKTFEHLLKMRESGDLTGPTLLAEAFARGYFATDVDPKQEAAAVEDEKQRNLDNALALGAAAGGGGGENEEEDEEEEPAKSEAA